MLLRPRERAQALIAFHREFLAGSVDELAATLGFLNAPDGTPLVGIVIVYAGAPAEGERVLKPLREFGPPTADLIQPMPYIAAQSMLDNAVPIGESATATNSAPVPYRHQHDANRCGEYVLLGKVNFGSKPALPILC
jgi:hypothetical protein